MSFVNIQNLERECRDDDLGNITEVCSLAEIEAAVTAFNTGILCDVPMNEILKLQIAKFPNSSVLKRSWEVAEIISKNSTRITKDLAMMTCMSIMQKYVQGKRWSNSKQVYTFDKDIAAELLRTQKDIELPYNIFDKLPFQHFYLDYSNCSEELKRQIGMDGCLISVQKSYFETGIEFYVILILVCNKGESTAIRSTVVINSEKDGVIFKDLKESIKVNFDVWNELNVVDTSGIINKDSNGVYAGVPDMNNTDFSKGLPEAINKQIAGNQLYLIVQSIFYLCSYEPDIRETPASKMQYRKAKQNKKKGTMLPAREYKVGERFGAAFRKWTQGQLNASTEHVSTGRHNKPHMRRAHWHRYWIGKRNSDERELIIKWISECFCGLDESEAESKLDAVVHKVNGDSQ